jgi:lipid-binding SYLF domain-containing protein
MVDYEIELQETLQEIERIEAIVEPYERQLDELRDKAYSLKVDITLEACGLRMGDKLAVTEELQSQLVAYAWRETWPLGAVITVDGVSFSDGDRAPKDYYEISVRITSHERTFTPVKIAKKMRAAYLASKAGE